MPNDAPKPAGLREALENLLEHAPDDCGDRECGCLYYKAALQHARAVLASETREEK
jgi:hypothetical protein